ncbi:MAG: hypothetical protein GF411_14600 [Candidatus Lokiarchaeota archaeon]|nr:hypothetical protein [Candidatus Lokiarchaeota archaeon]
MQENLFQIIMRDFAVTSTYLTVFILCAISIGMIRRSKKIVSSITGLAVYLFTFGVYTFFTSIHFLYQGISNASIEFIGNATWISGIIFFTYAMEQDQAVFGERKPFVTLFCLIFTLVSIPLGITLGMGYLAFIGLAVAIVYVTQAYLDRILELETARAKFPQIWFVLGFMLSGFANFIVAFDYSVLFFVIKNILVLVGVIFLYVSWWYIPSSEDLNWLFDLNRLLVVDAEASLPMVDFTFRQIELPNGGDEKAPDSILVAGAMSGINNLIGEILADKSGLDEIQHGSRTILFHRRAAFTCILITERSIPEMKYRLEKFALELEKRYRDELAGYQGNIDPFRNADNLVREVFS